MCYTEAVPQSDTNGRGRNTLLRQLAKLLTEILRLQLDPARGPALVRECRRRHALARPKQVPVKIGQTRKPTRKMKPRATEQPTENLTKPANRRNKDTKPQPGSATPDKGFPKGNCPASERKPRSSAQKRLEGEENTTHSRKGALTTARPLLVNARLTGETCAKHFADICYTASGSRAESQLHLTKRNIKAE